MLTIYDDATLEAALATPLGDTCRNLIGRIVSDARASDLWDQLTCIVLIDPNDDAKDLEGILGFDPKEGPLGNAVGELIPWWDWLEHHPGWFELLTTTGTDFAYFLLVPDAGGDRSGLAELCRMHEHA
ncbi:hypothetical protein GRI40_06205 [Altererythrobacter aerius]|uniref:Uncharacterized protein n=1 Tax=Tsuneonella aeria TaxID=1837929 RepID=A0A6I4TC36_9SPHN|nr:hypothetical protein [Tsuneonella aeria]MXO74812.1 hypothetical protein [Tsuneonella aeria]